MNTAETGKRKFSRVRRSGVGTGTSSLLMIFTVLCFATLAMLSLSTAASNERIQQRGVEGTKSVAEAKGAAAMQVAALDAELAELQKRESADYFADALALAQQQGWQTNAENNTISLAIDMQNGNQLVTQLQLLAPAAAGGARYAVLSQQSQLINGWTPEGEGQLWVPG